MKKRKTWFFFYFLTIAGVLLAAQWGSRAVTVIAESRPIEREHCIVIDPGHGGEDGGAPTSTPCCLAYAMPLLTPCMTWA